MSQLRQLSLFSAPEPARFDLMGVEFRQHVARLTGLVFCPAVDGGFEWIEWWNTATEEDTRGMLCADGSSRDFTDVWKIQTRKLQLVWEARTSGRRITLNQICAVLDREFKL